jgi:hypothetical protein
MTDFTFSEEEVTAIKKALERYRPTLLKCDVPEAVRQGLIDSFILSCEEFCGFFVTHMKNAPSKPEHLQKLEDLTKHLAHVHKELEKIATGRFFAPWFSEVNDLVTEKFEVSSIITEQLSDHAGGVLKPLAHITDLLKTVSKELSKGRTKTGRRTADLDSGLIRKLAELYKTALHAKPTKYIDGPFVLTVRTILEILGLKSEDPSRTVRAVLKTLS